MLSAEWGVGLYVLCPPSRSNVQKATCRFATLAMTFIAVQTTRIFPIRSTTCGGARPGPTQLRPGAAQHSRTLTPGRPLPRLKSMACRLGTHAAVPGAYGTATHKQGSSNGLFGEINPPFQIVREKDRVGRDPIHHPVDSRKHLGATTYLTSVRRWEELRDTSSENTEQRVRPKLPVWRKTAVTYIFGYIFSRQPCKCCGACWMSCCGVKSRTLLRRTSQHGRTIC